MPESQCDVCLALSLEELDSALAYGYGAILGASSLNELSTAVSNLIRQLLQPGVPGRISATSEGILNAVEANLEPQMLRLVRKSILSVEEALRESEARFRSLADLGSDWYWEKDAALRFSRFEGRFHSANKEAFASYIGHRVWELSLDAESGWESLRRIMKAHEPFRDFIHSRVLRNGTRRWYTASGDPIFAGEMFVGYRGVGRDITVQKAAEEQLQHSAMHDILTGLPNRAMFSALFERALKSARRYNRGLAVLFCDLDGFKSINDEMGHGGGDYLLQQLALNLVDAVRTSDVVVRLGGDEFLVLVPEVHAKTDLVPLARKILSAARTPIRIGEHECKVSASVGIAVFPEDGDSEKCLMKHADQAMYAAKGEGKDRFGFYS